MGDLTDGLVNAQRPAIFKQGPVNHICSRSVSARSPGHLSHQAEVMMAASDVFRLGMAAPSRYKPGRAQTPWVYFIPIVWAPFQEKMRGLMRVLPGFSHDWVYGIHWGYFIFHLGGSIRIIS